jgi:hypothetical protein
MNIQAFVIGLIVLLMSVLFYFMQNEITAQAVNANTFTVLSLIFPMFLFGGIILTIGGLAWHTT